MTGLKSATTTTHVSQKGSDLFTTQRRAMLSEPKEKWMEQDLPSTATLEYVLTSVLTREPRATVEVALSDPDLEVHDDTFKT